jgi:hypothetical protein
MASVHDLTNAAGFVFEGNVEQLGASATAGFLASAETVIVRVTKILKSPEALALFNGQRITVELKPSVTLQDGQPVVFFTHGIYYGDGLVVRELANIPPEATMEAQLNSAAQAGADSELTQRLAQAELVIAGVASAPKRYVVAAAAAPPTARPVSEHDADWWVATVTVDSVEKGAHSGPTREILFAHSQDIAWYNSPKVKAGDRGVFLLHARDHMCNAVPGRAVIHPLDFQPMEQTGRVRALLKGGPQ